MSVSLLLSVVVVCISMWLFVLLVVGCVNVFVVIVIVVGFIGFHVVILLSHFVIFINFHVYVVGVVAVNNFIIFVNFSACVVGLVINVDSVSVLSSFSSSSSPISRLYVSLILVSLVFMVRSGSCVRFKNSEHGSGWVFGSRAWVFSAG